MKMKKKGLTCIKITGRLYVKEVTSWLYPDHPEMNKYHVKGMKCKYSDTIAESDFDEIYTKETIEL